MMAPKTLCDTNNPTISLYVTLRDGSNKNLVTICVSTILKPVKLCDDRLVNRSAARCNFKDTFTFLQVCLETILTTSKLFLPPTVLPVFDNEQNPQSVVLSEHEAVAV